MPSGVLLVGAGRRVGVVGAGAGSGVAAAVEVTLGGATVVVTPVVAATDGAAVGGSAANDGRSFARLNTSVLPTTIPDTAAATNASAMPVPRNDRRGAPGGSVATGSAAGAGVNTCQGSSGSAARAAAASSGSTLTSSGEIGSPTAGGYPGGPPPRSFDRPMKNSISTSAIPITETRA